MSEDKDKQDAKSVMGNLSATRPARMSRRRDGDGASDDTPAAPRKPRKPRAASTAAAKPSTPAKPRTAKAKPRAAAKPRPGGPRAVRSGAPSLETSAPKTPPRPQPARPPKGAELVTTAVQATGELAQIGVKLGVRAAKRAIRRLPKP